MKISQLSKSLGVLIITILVNGTSFASSAQSDGVQSSRLLTSIEPVLASGFAAWPGYNDNEVYYQIELVADGRVAETITTTKNYYKFDLGIWKNHQFRVKAIAKDSNAVIEVGPDKPLMLVPQDHTWNEVTCSKTCNGPDYAWKLELMQSSEATSINAPAFLALRPVYETFDYTPGATNPTWQAMTPAAFSANSWHYITNNYAYTQVTLPSTPAAGSPQILDAYGTPMYGNTYFVQKQMEQFAYAQNNRTVTFNPSSTICSGGLTSSGGWIDRFNSYPDSSNSPPSGVDDAPTLSCTGTPGGYSGGGSGPGQSTSATPSGSNVEFYLCMIEGLGSFMSIVPCETYTTGGDGPPLFSGSVGEYLYGSLSVSDPAIIDFIEFEPISHDGLKVVIESGGGYTDSGTSLQALKNGLYKMTVFTQGGVGHPRYIEVMNTLSKIGVNR